VHKVECILSVSASGLAWSCMYIHMWVVALQSVVVICCDRNHVDPVAVLHHKDRNHVDAVAIIYHSASVADPFDQA